MAEEIKDTNVTNEEQQVETTFDENQLQKEQVSEDMEQTTDQHLINNEGKIQDLERKLEETENRYLRLQADYDNSRRRAKLDFEAAQMYRAQSLITDILPVLDNFERALKMEVSDDQSKSLVQGMEMIYKGLVDALVKEGVELIKTVGQEFDPTIHQAVMQVQEEGIDSNIIVEEFQKGYKLKDRVIRPSMVKVNQ